MLLPFLLLGLSAITHLLFFGWPQEVVFDEVYFADFVGNYSTGAYYFDIHPPFAKLLTKAFGDLLGTTYGVDVTSIGNALPWDIVLLRLLPIFAGILLPVVIYYVCRELSFSRLLAFAAGILVIFENSILVQSRFLLLDSILLLSGFSALLLYLLYIKRGGNKILLVSSAILAAAAFSTKWTGFAYVFLIVIAEIVRIRRVKEIIKFVAVYAVVGMVFYFSVFAIHFAYLINSGPGDPFMTPRFQKTLIGNPHSNDSTLREKQFFGKTFELNFQMYEANRTLNATHEYSSGFLTWPLMLRPVFYWQDGEGNNTKSYIYLLGNPLVYWIGTLSILVLAFRIIKKRMSEKVPLFILAGFLVNFLPFALIGRVMFLYHYEAALIFSILAFVWLLGEYVTEKRKLLTVFVIIGLVWVTFVFFSPLTYGLPMSDSELKARMWLKSWR